jgi:hypothetical protein
MQRLLVICGLLAMVTRPAGAGDQLKLAVDVTVIGAGGIGG